MARLLKWLALIMGVACMVIGAIHFVFGIDSVPGEGSVGATVDSRERFYAAMFLGYGLAWIWVARQSPISSTAVRWLACIFLLGGVGRILSMVIYGPPQWLQVALAAIELVMPLLYFWLSTADEKLGAQLRNAGESGTPAARALYLQQVESCELEDAANEE